MLRSIAVNDFSTFPTNKAEQIVRANNEGYVIGDAVLFHIAAEEYRIVGGPALLDWIHFHAQTRGDASGPADPAF